MADLPTTATLKEAKDVLRAEWEEGVECPCCTQFVKLYHRKITSSMAYALILLYRYFQTHPGDECVHMTDYLNSLDIPMAIKSGDNAKLRYWGLLEEKPEVREDGSTRAGFWKVTPLGEQFVRGEVKVLSHAKVFNSRSFGLIGEEIGIQEALGNKFNYSELMK